MRRQPERIRVDCSLNVIPARMFLETIHVLGLSVVVGSVAMMDLRLLGVGQRNRAISELTLALWVTIVATGRWIGFAT